MERKQMALAVHRGSARSPSGCAHAVPNARGTGIQPNVITNIKVLRCSARMLMHDDSYIRGKDVDVVGQGKPASHCPPALARRPTPNRLLQSNDDVVVLSVDFFRRVDRTVIGKALSPMYEPILRRLHRSAGVPALARWHRGRWR